METAHVPHKSPSGKRYAQKKVMPNPKCSCQDRLLLRICLFSLHPYLSPVTEGPRQDLWNEGGSRVGRLKVLTAVPPSLRASHVSTVLRGGRKKLYICLIDFTLDWTGWDALQNGLDIILPSID